MDATLNRRERPEVSQITIRVPFSRETPTRLCVNKRLTSFFGSEQFTFSRLGVGLEKKILRVLPDKIHRKLGG